MTQDLVSEGYRRSAVLTRRYGTTYYWGTALLPAAQRRHVYAVYGLCRLADDIVDDPAGTAHATPGERLADFETAFHAALDAPHAASEPVLAAVADTVHRCGIERACFDRFFTAMRMDLTRSRYETFADLCGYMDGSAAVIGEMMLPVLHPRSPAATEPARSLGLAFQLTNFLRDVGEDLDRGRVYLPATELADFGADVHARTVTPQWRAFMAYQIERNRRLYSHADTGVALLPPRAARCIVTARTLYSRILDRIEAADYDVFTRRARVPTPVKAATAARMMLLRPSVA